VQIAEQRRKAPEWLQSVGASAPPATDHTNHIHKEK
jgi:hypothetical protein